MEPNTWDEQTELAKERNRIAADRTLLTWVRTSVSFIGLGFGLGQILNILEGDVHNPREITLFMDLLTLFCVGLGVLVMVAAALEYQIELHQLQKSRYLYRVRPSLGLAVGVSVAIASIIAFVAFWQSPPSP